tara:strand:+ start:72 stop:1169 length:1098 start_codon:yes stop_codon:yes gene_type:complete
VSDQLSKAASQHRQQTGSALILAMLVTAMVAVLATQFAESFVRSASLAEARLMQQRFDTYLQGAETLAAQVLLMDTQRAGDRPAEPVDHLGESWAAMLPPMPTDDGFLRVFIEDAQGRFNINNLAYKTENFDDLGALSSVRFSAAQRHFIRMLQSLPEMAVTEAQAVAITEAIVDWVDEDDRVSGLSGAESLYYTGAGTVAQSANQLMHDVSELALVRHVTPQLLKALRPRVVALPVATSININTAPASVMSGVNDENTLTVADQAAVETFMELRDQQAFASVTEFLQSAQQSGLPSDPGQSGNTAGQVPTYSVSSEYFLAYIQVTIGEVSRYLTSMIHRDESGVSTLARYHNSFHENPFETLVN